MKGNIMLELNDYKCVEKYESGIYKGIPMEYRNHPKVQELMKTRLFTVRYRGKSKPYYNRPIDFCHKDYAETFAIYPYSNYEEFRTKDDYIGLDLETFGLESPDYYSSEYAEISAFKDKHRELVCEVAEKINKLFT